jgi:hypothetical protein
LIQRGQWFRVPSSGWLRGISGRIGQSQNGDVHKDRSPGFVSQLEDGSSKKTGTPR